MPADLFTVQRLHPEWGIVDIEYAPNGGIWAVGRDGGVFALNSEGGTTGETAPYAGSYTGLAPGDRVGERHFTGIDKTDGGYKLVSNLPGQEYAFFTAPVQPPAGGAAPAGDAPAPGPAAESGRDVFINTLVGMGFTRDQANSLGGNIWNASKTKSQDALYFDLINSAEYKARFPGMQALREQGMAISESQYITFERQYKSTALSYQLPDKFHDSPEDFGQLISKGVSPDEFDNRLRMARTAALSDPTFLDELAREVPGANLGDVTAFFLDPDMGGKMLEEKFVRAQYGTSARTTGFGMLSEADKNRLTAQGVTADQAQAGFATLSGGILPNTVEEAQAADQFTRDEAVGFVGEAGKGGASTSELNTRRARRQAQFQGGGGAAGGGAGKTGLGGS